MDDYFDKGAWAGVPAFIVVWIACVIYAVGQYGWFLGLPLGAVVGGFFASIAFVVAALLWPLIALGVICLVLMIAAS